MDLTRNTTINNTEYETSIFTGTKSLRIFTRLVKVCSSSIGNGLKGADVSSLTDAFKNIEIGDIISKLSDNFEPVFIDKLIKEILENTTCNNTQVVKNFDILFQGKLLHMFKVVLWVLEENYADFFEGISQIQPEEKEAE